MDVQPDPLSSSVLELLWRLPAADLEQNVADFTKQFPASADAVLNRVDIPSKICFDSETGKQFLGSLYNKQEGNLYRSPWSNKFFPSTDDQTSESITEGVSPDTKPIVQYVPADTFLDMERIFNDAYQLFVHDRYPAGIGSVLVWPHRKQKSGFCAAFLTKHTVPFSEGSICWDSATTCHVPLAVSHAFFRLSTSVIVSVKMENEECGCIEFSTRCVRDVESQQYMWTETAQDQTATWLSHLSSICDLVEDLEEKILIQISELMPPNISQVLASLRIPDPQDAANHGSFMTTMLAELSKQKTKV